MAVGFPTKANWAAGDVLTASAMDDLAGTVNTLSTAGSTSGQVMTSAGANAAVTWTNMPGMTLISTTSLSGATVTLSSIPQTYKKLILMLKNVTNATANGYISIKLNNATTGFISGTYLSTSFSYVGSAIRTPITTTYTNGDQAIWLEIDDYTATSTNIKPVLFYGFVTSPDTPFNSGGMWYGNTAITSLVISNSGGNLSTGTALLYGVN